MMKIPVREASPHKLWISPNNRRQLGACATLRLPLALHRELIRRAKTLRNASKYKAEHRPAHLFTR